jgi:hypothetical protein
VHAFFGLYGIQFEFDSDTVRPDSDPTLAEIATLLAAEPALSLFVVGHTEIAGGHDYNLDLPGAGPRPPCRTCTPCPGAALPPRFECGVVPNRRFFRSELSALCISAFCCGVNLARVAPVVFPAW